MKTMGIFEVKTRFPSVCSEVEATGLPVLVRRRGKPLVIISPVSGGVGEGRTDIHTAWKQWLEEHGNEDDFPEVWKNRSNKETPPLGE